MVSRIEESFVWEGGGGDEMSEPWGLKRVKCPSSLAFAGDGSLELVLTDSFSFAGLSVCVPLAHTTTILATPALPTPCVVLTRVRP